MRFRLNYAKSMYYKLVCRDSAITEKYVGFTTNKYTRLQYHKEACSDPQNWFYFPHLGEYLKHPFFLPLYGEGL